MHTGGNENKTDIPLTLRDTIGGNDSSKSEHAITATLNGTLLTRHNCDLFLNYGTILAFSVFLSCSEKFTYVRGKGKRTKIAIDAPVLLMK